MGGHALSQVSVRLSAARYHAVCALTLLFEVFSTKALQKVHPSSAQTLLEILE